MPGRVIIKAPPHDDVMVLGSDSPSKYTSQRIRLPYQLPGGINCMQLCQVLNWNCCHGFMYCSKKNVWTHNRTSLEWTLSAWWKLCRPWSWVGKGYINHKAKPVSMPKKQTNKRDTPSIWLDSHQNCLLVSRTSESHLMVLQGEVSEDCLLVSYLYLSSHTV